MTIQNNTNIALQTMLSTRPTNPGIQKALENHLEKLGDKFLNKLQPAQAREILFRQIAQRLSAQGASLPAPTSNPAALVQMGVQLQQQGMASDRVRNEIQQGLDEGRQQLDSPNLPAQTQASIDQFADQLDQEIAQSPLAALYQQDSYRQSNSAAIEIRTKQGDVITIHLSANSSSDHTRLGLANDRSAASLYESVQANSSQLRITIEGELDADELKGLSHLLGKISGLADKFFNGQEQAALSSLSGLQLDDSLAGFNMHLQSAEQTQQTMAYVDQRPLPGSTLAMDNRSLLAQARELIDDSNDNARDTFRQLLQTMIQLKQQNQPAESLIANEADDRRLQIYA
ncbi:MAG: hypothetical protein OEW58_11595 [Gammaproteobacteria bacterium]|nr:hypothetical protein [Gammaproteobacteria bacterium]